MDIGTPKKIFTGLEGHGKSLALAMCAYEVVRRNNKWYNEQVDAYNKDKKEFNRKYKSDHPVIRPIVSNLKFKPLFEEWAKDMGIPIYYWQNLDELIQYKGCDVFCDEVGNYFDAVDWVNIPLNARRWITQGNKMGIEFYGSSQDFAQVAKAFRRVTTDLIHVRKVIGSQRPTPTKPPILKPWGFCQMVKLDPRTYNEDKDKFGTVNLFNFSGFFIRKMFCDFFDTTQEIKRGQLMPFMHLARQCNEPGCGFHKIMHV